MVAEKNLEEPRANERIIEMELERLREFSNHPFKVNDDSQMAELQDSISRNGILNPLIIRPMSDGAYEIISGHRRKYAAEKLGYRKVPVIIRYLRDDEAVISMVDSNLQRECISPSEKAFAYKMKYDVMKRKTGRKKRGQIDHFSGRKSLDIISEECGESPKQIQRYIKIADLIPELLEKVDDGSMGFTPAVQISYLNKKEQKDVLEAMKYAIEITDDGCVETLEFPNGEKFTKRSKRTNFGCQSIDDDFSEQMERGGYSEDVLDAVYNLFDGFNSLDFLELDDLVNVRF